MCPDEGGSPWREIRTTHFALKTNLSSEGALQSVRELEQFRGALLSVLWPDSQEPPGVLETIVLRNPSQLEEFAGPHIGGYFARSRSGPLMVMSSRTYLAGDYGLDVSIVAHELTHYLSSFALARQPKWLAEGFATYMETAKVLYEDGRVEVGSLPPDRLRFAERHRVPLAMLWTWGVVPIESEDASDLYATSWLLVHLLINHHPQQFAAFLDRLGAGEEPGLAFAAALPAITPEQLDHELASYVSSGKYAVIQIRTTGEETPARERQLSPAAAHLARANLWLNSPGVSSRAEAESRALSEIDEALRHSPKDADALVLRQQLVPSNAGARALTELLPSDPRAWRQLARTLEADPKGQAAALDRSLALNGADAEVLIVRSQLHAVAGNLEAALNLSEKAVALEPFSVDALIAFARANAQAGNCSVATQAYSRAIERLAERGSDGTRALLLEQRRKVERSCGKATPAE